MIIKLVIGSLIVFCCAKIGFLISKKYVYRLEELQEFKNIFTIIENKIKYTYEPLEKIFLDISKLTSENFKVCFENMSKNIKTKGIEFSWNDEIEKLESSLNSEDKEKLKEFSTLLGKSNKEGQINQIDYIKELLEVQIKKAQKDQEKNETVYKKLGLILGIGLVIIIF